MPTTFVGVLQCRPLDINPTDQGVGTLSDYAACLIQRHKRVQCRDISTPCSLEMASPPHHPGPCRAPLHGLEPVVEVAECFGTVWRADLRTLGPGPAGPAPHIVLPFGSALVGLLHVVRPTSINDRDADHLWTMRCADPATYWSRDSLYQRATHLWMSFVVLSPRSLSCAPCMAWGRVLRRRNGYGLWA
jgi:hypothetical protein